jgi:hypothetical protein
VNGHSMIDSSLPSIVDGCGDQYQWLVCPATSSELILMLAQGYC